VVFPGGFATAGAISKWTLPWLRERLGTVAVLVKTGSIAEPTFHKVLLSEFLTAAEHSADPVATGYLHDWPLLSLDRGLGKDLQPFPIRLIPHWYHQDYLRFVRVFIGPSGAQTPLHFDRQETHNLFFQIRGRKRFTLCLPKDIPQSHFHAWRWANLNLDCLPRTLRVSPKVFRVTLEAGDILYMPPRTPHQVVSETLGISLNLDWHDRRSVLSSLTGPLRGMPWADVFTNLRTFIGMYLGLPVSVMFPGNGSYLP
jgi:hypothetical protein